MSRWGKGENRILAAERDLLNAQLQQSQRKQSQRERAQRAAEQRAKRVAQAMPEERKPVAAQTVWPAAAEAEAQQPVAQPPAPPEAADGARARNTAEPNGGYAVAQTQQTDPVTTAEAEARAHPAEADGTGGEPRTAASAPLTVQPTTPTPPGGAAAQRPLLPGDGGGWPPELVRLHEALALSIAGAIREHAMAAADQGARPEESDADALEVALHPRDQRQEEALRLVPPSHAGRADPANLPRRLQPSLRATEIETSASPIPPAVAPTDTDLCHIELWRGYLSSTFYIRLGEDVLESKSFRWRGATPPDAGGPRAAYDELVSRLAARGWQAYARGPHWFATSFSRPWAPR